MFTEMVSSGGFPENMTKFSYFPSAGSRNRRDISCDRDVLEMITHSTELENMNIYVVRADDPYLDDVLIERDDEEEEPESDGEKTNFYEDDYVDDDDSDDDGAQIEFHVGQAFATREKFRETVEKYAVKEKWNIHFQRSERKKVAAVCVDDCEWRIYASINSRSENMVVRSYHSHHTCYPTGVVKLYSAPKIAADFLNEFRTNPKLSADQITQRLSLKGLRVTKNRKL